MSRMSDYVIKPMETEDGINGKGYVHYRSWQEIYAEQKLLNLDNVIRHYDTLIDEDNDPARDPEPLRAYMDKWDGPGFIDRMGLDASKSVLEIGVGTGRLAVRTAPLCGVFFGIDISSKTVERARENLAGMKNVALVCGDFNEYEFGRTFDVIYSSLTFMHMEAKQRAVDKIAGLLNDAGKFVLSIDKNRSEYIDTGTSRLRVCPDDPEAMAGYIRAAGLTIMERYDTEFATVFVAQKGVSGCMNEKEQDFTKHDSQEIDVRNLSAAHIPSDLLCSFEHRQLIERQWVKKGGAWELADTSVLQEWSAEKKVWVTEYMCEQIERGGAAIGAFRGDTLVGFCCIDGKLDGNCAKYANLTMLFIDDNWKRRGIGKELFQRACQYASGLGADKLFISAIPSVDTIAFYQSLGCVDAKEILEPFVDTEEDRYLEYVLGEVPGR